MRDVSKLANVSVATVSRVMNNNGYVNERTKEKVLAAIKELNYRPNDVARSLFKGKSKMIALFVPDIRNPFFPELARAVEDISNMHHYTFILCNTDNDPAKEVNYLNALLQKSIDGVIIVSSTMSVKQLREIKVPIVALDRKLDAEFPAVTVNNREGAKIAVRYLKETGCKHIAHIAGPQDIISSSERMKGYLDVVQKEYRFSDDYIRFGNYTYEDAFEVAKELLTSHSTVDGIFAANDLMAIGVLKAAEYLGINVPNDLSIIGFDGITIGRTTSPTLTTMEQPIYIIGKRATEILLQQIEEPDRRIPSEEYKVTLIQRESTKERS